MGEKTKDKKKSEKKAQKTSWFQGMKSEFKKVIWPDKKTLAKQTAFHSILASFSLFLPGSTLQQVLPEETDLSQTKMDLPEKPPQNPAQKYIKSGWLSHIPDNTTL